VTRLDPRPPSRARLFALLFVLTLAWGGGGCDRRPVSSAEARAVMDAYRAFQEASFADRPQAMAALERVPCTAKEVCDSRDACVGYARALHRANELSGKARTLGPEDAGGSGAATQGELAIIISAADDAVKKAEGEEPRCREALTRLGKLDTP
jgi:hypothetical protein